MLRYVFYLRFEGLGRETYLISAQLEISGKIEPVQFESVYISDNVSDLGWNAPCPAYKIVDNRFPIIHCNICLSNKKKVYIQPVF